MKKKGFTLSEVLIAVCIIGVISAIMASAFNQTKPDKTKMMYIKAYDALTTAVSSMANDSSLFAEYLTLNQGMENEVTYDISDAPFFDATQPTSPYFYDSERFSGLQGRDKFTRLLCYALNGESVNGDSCNTAQSQLYDRDGTLANPSFRTGPGNMEWWVSPTISGNYPFFGNDGNGNNTIVMGSHQVYLNIDGRYVGGFCVRPNGNIEIIEQMGATYIQNRRNIRSRNDVQATTGFNEYGESACLPSRYDIDANNVLVEHTPSGN